MILCDVGMELLVSDTRSTYYNHTTYILLLVKTIDQLKEGFKTLSDKLHHSKIQSGAQPCADQLLADDNSCKSSPTLEAEKSENCAERSISQLEKWSDDGFLQPAESEPGAGRRFLLERVKKMLTCLCEVDDQSCPRKESLFRQYSDPPLDPVATPLLITAEEESLHDRSRQTSSTYSSDFPYLALDASKPLDIYSPTAQDNEMTSFITDANGDHKLRQFIAKPLTDKITQDFDYLKDELHYLRFRYIDTEVKENVQNMEVALREGNQALLVDEWVRFEAAADCLKAGIDDAFERAHSIIVWRVQCEVERLIKNLT